MMTTAHRWLMLNKRIWRGMVSGMLVTRTMTGMEYWAFPLESNESVDTDGDGAGDNSDNCRYMSNSNQQDSNWNNIGDACEEDDGFIILLPVIKQILDERAKT